MGHNSGLAVRLPATKRRPRTCTFAHAPGLCAGQLAGKARETCTIRYLSRLTTSVSRVAPPRGLSQAYGACYFRVPLHRYPHTVRTTGGRTCLVFMRQAAKRDVGIPAASSLVEDRGFKPRTFRVQNGCSIK